MNPTYTQPYTRNWGEKRGTTWWSFGNYLIKRPDGGEAYMVLLCSVMSFDSVYTSKPIWQVCGLTAAPSLLPGSAAPSADESLWLCLVKSQIFSQWWGWGCISLSGGTILTFWRVEKVRFISYKNKKKYIEKFRWYWASCFLSHHLTTLLSPCAHNKADALLAAWIFFFRYNIFHALAKFCGEVFLAPLFFLREIELVDKCSILKVCIHC